MNFRLLLGIAFIVALTACGGAEERKAVYMEKAKASMKAGDLDKARIELKNVLQIDPKDSEAYYQLGKLYEKRKDYRKAFSNYKKSEELNPEFLANQARIGRLYLLLTNDFEKAQEKIDLILSEDPDNSEGLLLKAAFLVKKDKINEALDIGKGIVERDPENIDAIIFVASVYIKEDKLNEAIDVLDVALKLKQDDDQLNNLLVLILVKNKEYERAELIYRKFLEKYPDSRSSYDRLAFLYDLAGDTSRSESILRESVKNNPDDADRYLILIRYLNQIKNEDEAIKELERFVKENESLGKLKTALAELYYSKGDKLSAIEIYNEIMNDFPEEVSGVDAGVSLATHYFNDRDFDKADQVVEKIINISPNNPKLNIIRARLALQKKDVEKAIIALRIVTKETPENIDAYFMLINAYKLENNDKQVLNTLNLAYENNKTNADALLKLTKYYLGRDFDKAEKIIDSYNGLKESDYEGMSIKAAILNANKKESAAYELAKKLTELYPGKPNGYLQSVPFLTQKNDVKDAVSVLEKGYMNVEDNRKILALLTQLQVSEKKFDIAEKRIKAELDATPDDDVLKMLLAKVYLISNKERDAEILLKEIVSSKPGAEEPYLLLSQIYKNANDENARESVLVKGKENVAASHKIPLKLAALYEARSEYDKAISVYRDMYKIYPDNMIVVNNLASLLSDYSQDKDDLKLMKLLVEKLEKREEPIFLDTIGWVYFKLGDYSKAVQSLVQVVEQAPTVNVFNYHLGMAYKMSGDEAQAKIYLEKSLHDGKQFKQRDMAEAALKNI